MQRQSLTSSLRLFATTVDFMMALMRWLISDKASEAPVISAPWLSSRSLARFCVDSSSACNICRYNLKRADRISVSVERTKTQFPISEHLLLLLELASELAALLVALAQQQMVLGQLRSASPQLVFSFLKRFRRCVPLGHQEFVRLLAFALHFLPEIKNRIQSLEQNRRTNEPV